MDSARKLRLTSQLKKQSWYRAKPILPKFRIYIHFYLSPKGGLALLRFTLELRISIEESGLSRLE